MSENERFDNLRKRVAKLIEAALAIDPYCKSYEGTWEIMCSYQNYFDDPTGTAPRSYFFITLHCYVLGSGRHHQWTGRKFAEALGECERTVMEWEHDGRKENCVAVKQPYTERQFNYAVAIKCALGDNADLWSMDKWEMRDYISRALSDPESKRRIYEYNAKMWAHAREMRRIDRQRERKRERAWLSDESLGADWGLDASDFGAQAWGDS